jgi:Ca-activated chloride channel family protein
MKFNPCTGECTDDGTHCEGCGRSHEEIEEMRNQVAGLVEFARRFPQRYVDTGITEQHTVTLPVSVNVVPADVAAGRVPSADVQRERLMLEAQRAKKASEDALRQGDYEGARDALDGAAGAFLSAPPAMSDAEFLGELDWLRATRDGLADWDRDYSSKRMRSDRMRKSRGYKSREQGGEV